MQLVGPFDTCSEANAGQGQIDLYQLKTAGGFGAAGVSLFVSKWENLIGEVTNL